MSNREVGGRFMCINDLSIKTFQQTFSPYTHTHARMHTHTRTYLHTHSRKLEHTHIHRMWERERECIQRVLA